MSQQCDPVSCNSMLTIVTGGSRGLGLAITRTLLASGKRVAVLSRSESPTLLELAQEYPGCLNHFRVDLSITNDFSDLLMQIEKFGMIEGAVLNAALGSQSLFVLQTTSEITSLINTNFTSAILLSQAIAKRLVTRRAGSIVFISSAAARKAYKGLAVYGALKAALERFSVGLALELGRYNVRVNSVAPGFLPTEMSSTLDQEQRSTIARRSALQRLPSIDAVAWMVRSLLSEDSKDTSGAIIPVDCGNGL